MPNKSRFVSLSDGGEDHLTVLGPNRNTMGPAPAHRSPAAALLVSPCNQTWDLNCRTSICVLGCWGSAASGIKYLQASGAFASATQMT